MNRNGKASYVPATTSEHVTSGAEHVTSGSERVTSASERAATTPKRATSASERVTSASEQAAITPKRVTSASEQAAADSDPANGGAKRVRERRAPAYQSSGSIEQRLTSAQRVIAAALDDGGLREGLAGRGYDTASLAEGQALRDRALALVQQRHAVAAATLDATDARDAARTRAHAVYVHHVAIARIALKDGRGASRALDLSPRKATQDGWLMQAQRFYANILADAELWSRLAAYGIAASDLEATQREVMAVEEAGRAQKQRQEALRAATAARDAALTELDRWMRGFTAVTRLVIAERAQAPRPMPS